MDSDQERVIELSRAKIVLALLGACVFVAIGIWMLSLDDEFIRAQRRMNDPTLVHLLGGVSILFFGGGGGFLVRKLFDRRPGLVLSSSGIVDNASGIAVGFIPWSDVTDFRVHEIQGQKLLVILVRDPAPYVARGSALKRAANRANLGLCGSPIVISSHALKISFAELLALFANYRPKQGTP
jgi:hypothetical protein